MLLLKGYHYLGYNGNGYGYFNDVLYGDISQTTEAGLYYDFIPDKGWELYPIKEYVLHLTQ